MSPLSTAGRLACLLRLHRCATYPRPTGYPILASVTKTRVSILHIRQGSSGAQYEQIPEHLKIHMFTSELEIIRNDELRSPFKDFSADFILALLTQRSNEVRMDQYNSNPGSRINSANITRFMKVASRLRQLFDLNGGNTEVLDAVLNSQSTLALFEAKLAAKKAAREAKQKASEAQEKLYAPGPYLQIPDDLCLHDYVEELKAFRDHELKKPFGNVAAKELMDLMDSRLKAVYQNPAGFSSSPGISSQNLVSFFNLHSKLQKLLARNGGVTSVLDTLIHSQNVFENFETAMTTSKPSDNSTMSYRHLPEDFILEEYENELKQIRSALKDNFSNVSASDILEKVLERASSNLPDEKKLAFSKLFRNLSMLFKHNNNQTFILDNVLLNATEFKAVEAKLKSRRDAKQGAVKQAQLGEMEKEAAHPMCSLSYRDAEHILALLNKKVSGADVGLFSSQSNVKAAVNEALSKEEKILLENDPNEYDLLLNLTPGGIRESYAQSRAKLVESSQKLDVDSLSHSLKELKKKKDLEDQTRSRERAAFEWSLKKIVKERPYNAKSLFRTSWGRKRLIVPMFPGNDPKVEYLILTADGKQIVAKENPLGLSHIPEDMFGILRDIPEQELAKYSANIEKLIKKNWSVIGSQKPQGMLVLSRVSRTRRQRVLAFVKGVATASGLCFITLVLANMVLTDHSTEEEQKAESSPQAPEAVADAASSTLVLDTLKSSMWK